MQSMHLHAGTLHFVIPLLRRFNRPTVVHVGQENV